MPSLSGKFFSGSFVSTASGDIVSQVKTALGVTNLTIRKMSLTSASPIHIDINTTGIWSSLYQYSTDVNVALDLDANDVIISSLKTKEADSNIFVAMIYS
jgi:hypothetical protein